MRRRFHHLADPESVRSRERAAEPGRTDGLLDRRPQEAADSAAEQLSHYGDRSRPESTGDGGEGGEVRETALGYFPQLVFRLDPQLSDRLRLVAYARRRTPSALAAELLRRGLEREARRERAEAALAILTPREREVARLTVRGLTNREIARALVISPETVKSHLRSLLGKFALRSKAELRLRLQEVDKQP